MKKLKKVSETALWIYYIIAVLFMLIATFIW